MLPSGRLDAVMVFDEGGAAPACRANSTRMPKGWGARSDKTHRPPCIVGSVVNTLFRALLAIWTIGFLVVSCVPMLTGSAVAGGVGLLTGAVLLVPWLVGVLILSLFVWLTNPRRP